MTPQPQPHRLVPPVPTPHPTAGTDLRTLLRQPLADAAVETLDIGVDLDGVVYDFVGALRMFIHITTGRPLHTMPEPTTWNFFETDWGMPLAQFLKFVNDGVNAGYLFRVGAPMPGVVDGLNALLAAGHRIHIVTDRARSGRAGQAEENTRSNLAEHGVNFTTLTLSHDKTTVRTDTFIDDRPENYLSLVAGGVDAYLRAHAYNAHVEVPAGRRVDGFTPFVTSILSRAA